MRWLLAILLCIVASDASALYGEPRGDAPHRSLVSQPYRERYNVLIISLDDVGREELTAYEVTAAASTPSIDALDSAGIRFINGVATPICGPTRTNMLTGQYAFRHLIQQAAGNEFIMEAPTFAKVVNRASNDRSYPIGIFGKYGTTVGSTGGTSAYSSAYHGFTAAYVHNGAIPGDYYNQTQAINFSRTELDPFIVNSTRVSTNWAPADNEADFLAWLDTLAPGEPWVAWISFNTAHPSYQQPPGGSCTPDSACLVEMIEDADTRIGNILGDSRVDLTKTLVIFIGDNGSADNGCKGAVIECGFGIPFIAAHGPITNTGDNSAQVTVSDIYATILDYTGAGEPDFSYPTTDEPVYDGGRQYIDGLSLRGIFEGSCNGVARCTTTGHQYVYSSGSGPMRADLNATDVRVVRSNSYYWRISQDGTTTEVFYPLSGDIPVEGTELCTGDCDTNLTGADRTEWIAMDAWLCARLTEEGLTCP